MLKAIHWEFWAILAALLAMAIYTSSEGIICPECKEQGLKSTVTYKWTTGTLLAQSIQYDSDGYIIPFKDINVYSSTYTCSQGHTFVVEEKGLSSDLNIEEEPTTVTAPSECEELRKENEWLKRENCLLRELIDVYHKLVQLFEERS